MVRIFRPTSCCAPPKRTMRQTIGDISEAEVWEALERFDPLWDELFPAEQARVIQLLVVSRTGSTSGCEPEDWPIWPPN